MTLLMTFQIGGVSLLQAGDISFTTPSMNGYLVFLLYRMSPHSEELVPPRSITGLADTGRSSSNVHLLALLVEVKGGAVGKPSSTIEPAELSR